MTADACELEPADVEETPRPEVDGARALWCTCARDPGVRELSSRQREALAFVLATLQSRGFPPTIREIGAHLGVKSTNAVSEHLVALERKGYIAISVCISRGLRVVLDADGVPIEQSLATRVDNLQSALRGVLAQLGTLSRRCLVYPPARAPKCRRSTHQCRGTTHERRRA